MKGGNKTITISENKVVEDVGGNCGSESATLGQRILSTEQHRTILRSLPWVEEEDMKLIHGRKGRCLEVAILSS